MIIGILEWFKVGEYDRVEQALADLKRLHITHLRTGLSWADFHRPDGEAWYDWLIPRLAEEVDVLPCITYTPPTLGIVRATNSPPRDPQDYAGFVDWVVGRYKDYFDWVELWNEPNNLTEWDWTLDPDWTIFITMTRQAAEYIHAHGLKTLLGGLSPTDAGFYDFLFQQGLMQHMDAVGIHGFPGIWESNWKGWDTTIKQVQDVLDQYNSDATIWITETGYSTWRHDYHNQCRGLIEVLEASADRVYWYSLHDLNHEHSAMTGFHQDEREYHFGMRTQAGDPKLLFRLWAEEGLDAVRDVAHIHPTPLIKRAKETVLITGGAGFVGTNLADYLLEDGHQVIIYDNLERANVEHNLHWLRYKHGQMLSVYLADVRDPHTLQKAVAQAQWVYHFAAQVAVTLSLDDPIQDFAVNARGTLNVLEAIRAMSKPPSLVFTSTNKVYGALKQVHFQENGKRFKAEDKTGLFNGVDETTPLSFHSPYACSKGAADQYVLDYARMFDIPAAVFRMSCIYGAHQFGNEDQGWVAHFLIKALRDEPITIFGNGKQVRDILYVDDLVQALLKAQKRIDTVSGEAFNVGGGSKNTVSLLELLGKIEALHGHLPEIKFEDWRPGDQVFYVSKIDKFFRMTGWRPTVSVDDGLERLYHWLLRHPHVKTDPALLKEHIHG